MKAEASESCELSPFDLLLEVSSSCDSSEQSETSPYISLLTQLLTKVSVISVGSGRVVSPRLENV